MFFVVLGVSALIPLSPFSEGLKGFAFLETQKQGGSSHDEMLDIYAYMVVVLLLIFNVVVIFFSCTQSHKLYLITFYKRTIERTELIIEIFTGEKAEDEEKRRMKELGGHNLSEANEGDQKLAAMGRRGRYVDDPEALATIQFDDPYHSSIFARTVLNESGKNSAIGLDENPGDKSFI